MPQGQSQVRGKCFYQGAHHQDAVDQQNQPRQQQTCHKAGPRHAARYRWARHGAGAPGHRDVRAVAFQAQARHVQDERQGEQDGADCRRAGQIAEAGDQCIGLGRQHGEAPADQGRIAEIFQDINRRHQRGSNQPRARQWQRHRAKYVPRASPEVAGRLFQARVAARQHIGDQLVSKGEKRNGLDAPQPAQAEHIGRLSQQPVCDDAARPEQQNVTRCHHEGR